MGHQPRDRGSFFLSHPRQTPLLRYKLHAVAVSSIVSNIILFVLTSLMLSEWFTYAHDKVLARRHELICADNQTALFRMMEEADNSAAEIIAAEKAIREKLKAEEEYKIKMEIQQKIAMDKAKIAREKQLEEALILSIQRDKRKKQLYHRWRAY